MENNKLEILSLTSEYVKSVFQGDCSGHDWWHTYRVWGLSKLINTKEHGDKFVVEMAALLHDLDDHKFKSNNDCDGSCNTIKWLSKFTIATNLVDHIVSIVNNISFKGANEANKISTIEGMIVQDADRLDAIGAIGIARTFAFGGHKGHPIYEPEEVPTMHNSFKEYKLRHSSSISHFYEKLLLLKDRMNTKTGAEIAQLRHGFMQSFLEHFLVEWNSEDIVIK